MKVMVMVRSTKASEAGEMPSAQLMAEMGAYNEALIKAGVLVAGDGLKSSASGKRVRFSGTKRSVLDGPFTETKELIAGYWIWEVGSMAEAVEWARRCPNPMPAEDSELELREVFGPEDFPAP